MKNRLTIAIQKKGRLFNHSSDLIRKSGINFSTKGDTLLAKSYNLPIDILFVRSEDIPSLVSNGDADLAIVGENVLIEKSLFKRTYIEKIINLGFSNCRLSFAAPKNNKIKSFNNMKIATSYPNTVKKYLKDKGINASIININGSVLMCKEIIPHFKAQKYGKIIQLSGGGATNPLPNISAYAVTKSAIVRFAETLAEEVRNYGIDVNSIAPGALNTGMLDEIILAGPEKVGNEFYEKSLKQKETGGAPITKAAELAIFLASSASDGITAKLISALWDNWQSWPEYKELINNSDMYTLRRIIGRDRNFEEGDK